MNDHEASEILTGIADMIEGQIEQINLSLYPISENVVIYSRVTIAETNCEHATDALHLYIADKANCDYFVTADHTLYSTLNNSHLKLKLIPINISNVSDMSRLLSR
jgi:predicted nucleic acid-binding protein